MRLDPYASVDGLAFTVTPEDVRRRHGAPRQERRNELGLVELDYGHVVYRFQEDEEGARLEEVTSRVAVLHLPEAAVPFASLAAFVREHDVGSFRVGGFFVSPRFGLAFDPADSNWVTVLAEHCLPQWRSLAGPPR